VTEPLRDTRDVTDSTGKWRAIQEEFLATGAAAAVEKALTLFRDESVADAYRTVVKSAFPQGVAMLASGAYGRGHTFPYSELDIVLLADSTKRGEALRDRLPEFVRLLWNAGLRPNTAVHTVAECLEAVERASVIAFSLLDQRFLEGDRVLYNQLDAKFPLTLSLHREKMRQRLCEATRARHAAHENTPCHAEPDVKEGPGGLQDVRALGWLARLKTEKVERSGELNRAVAGVASVRCFLHYRAEGDHNTLDFEAQASLAQQKFAPAAREYFHCARTIFNETRRAVDEAERSESSLLENFREYRSRLSNQEFTVSRERLLLRNPAHLAGDPMLLLRLLEFIGRHGVLPSSETERRLEASRELLVSWCAQPRPLWNSLKVTLASPHAGMALRTLYSTGLLRAILPEWEAIEGLVNSEFRYTVDEHTLRTTEAVFELGGTVNPERPPERQRFAVLLSEVDDAALVVFALLFHDMGDEAAERARTAGMRMEMPAEAREVVEFQILHRSDLSDAMTGRDLDDPATVRLLSERVGTTERLRLLAVATYARMVTHSAVDKVAWRLDQLWRTYSATQHELLRELETDRIEQVPRDLPGNAGFVRGFPLRYLRAHSPAEIQEHLQLFEQSRPTGVAVKLQPLEGAYRITIVARDKPSLFASFAGAISSFGLDILKAEAFSNATGVIMDTFVVADPKRMLQFNPSEADRLSDLLQRIALGRTDAQKLLRGRPLPDAGRRTDPPRVQFDSEACPTATLVEIDAEDRPGLLYSLATVFSSSACNIDIVLVDTKGHRAIDVFYVAHEGRKLPPELQARLREKLINACRSSVPESLRD
jgi:[protein-PII] uridylyltransferase